MLTQLQVPGFIDGVKYKLHPMKQVLHPTKRCLITLIACTNIQIQMHHTVAAVGVSYKQVVLQMGGMMVSSSGGMYSTFKHYEQYPARTKLPVEDHVVFSMSHDDKIVIPSTIGSHHQVVDGNLYHQPQPMFEGCLQDPIAQQLKILLEYEIQKFGETV